jgi:FkbM family methyltransferase
MRFYVDLGANEGNTIADWLAANPESVALGVEPNPELAQSLCGRFAGDSRVSIVAAAAGTQDGEALLYPGIRSDESSTLVPDKDPRHSWGVDYAHGYPVPVVDVARLIAERWPDCEDAVIKIDIEAAEYQVIPHLIASGVMARFAEARVEWHWRKFNIPRERHDATVQALRQVTRAVDWK